MFLAGHISFEGQIYYIVWNSVKNSETYWCFSKYHRDDVYDVQMGGEPAHAVISGPLVLKNYYNEDYLLEILRRTKISGKVSMWGQNQVIETLLDTIAFAKNYNFAKADIKKDSITSGIEIIAEFVGSDKNIYYEYIKDNTEYTKVVIKYSGVEVELSQVPFKLNLNKFELKDTDKLYAKRILSKTLKDIDFNLLSEMLDMSWYRVGDKILKDYNSVKTVYDFETLIMTPMVLCITEHMSNNTVFDVAVDTETSGLNIYNLSPDNPDKDHVVAIPISWKVDTGYVIFTDMEHFSNVNNDYVVHRLAEIFENFKGERAINIWVPKNSSDSLVDMNLFDSKTDDLTVEQLSTVCERRSVLIRRDAINLIGHNVMFDKRAFIDSKSYFYFNNDTMQMSFNLSSRLIKGSNKLKNLTRKLFGHETPELEDILGKGNEDKYRFLTDEEVADIYGCADADYTLRVYLYLVELMTPTMYERYQTLDVPILNILPKSEYDGLNIDEEKAFALGDCTYKDIEILEKFMYDYVGIFVNGYKQRENIEAKRAAGYYATDEEYQEAVNSIDVSHSKSFEFEFKPKELRTVLFNILKYPVKAYTTGANPQPKLDKYVMEKLIDCKRDPNDKAFTKLNHDIISSAITKEEYDRLRASGDPKSAKKADSMVLISAEKFNKCKYPVALVMQKHGELKKEYTAYYKPMRETNMESKIFKSYSLARIETRRIQNSVQTMKGNLKALVKAYSDDYYLLDFDMSQVEYRIMLSLAGYMEMVDRMKDPERDYHTETASLINNIPAHKIDKKTRKSAKSVSFGVPYGLGIRRLCDKIFGVINDETLFATRMLLAKWEKANKPVMDFLNKERDNALVAREMSNELRDFMDAWQKDENANYVYDSLGHKVPKPTGFIYDKYGFYRTFDVSDVEQGPEADKRRSTGKYTNAESKIRRPAGNFPIQCFAAELFRIILIRFYNRCEEEGINDKILWHMLIHDELLCSVHKSVHPFLLYKIVKESCMVTMKGHTKYFVGINIGNTWGEVKDDAREAPVYFVDRIIKRWDAGEFGTGPFWFDDPWNELIKDERAKYVDDRIGEVIHQVQPDIDNAPINIPHILEHFDNYTVRAYVNDYPFNSLTDANFSKEDFKLPETADKLWVSRFESWALGHFDEGKPLIDFSGKLTTLRRGNIEAADDEFKDDFDYVLMFDEENDDKNPEGSYWSYDVSECNTQYDSGIGTYYDDTEDVFSYELDDSVTDASNIAEMLKVKTKYKNLNIMYEQVMITIPHKYCIKVKQYLEKYVAHTGKSIVFNCIDAGAERWLRVNEQVDWNAVDEFISNMLEFEQILELNSNYKPKHFSVIGNKILLCLQNKYKFVNCEAWLQNFSGDNGYDVILKTAIGDIKKLDFKVSIPFDKLDGYVEKE